MTPSGPAPPISWSSTDERVAGRARRRRGPRAAARPARSATPSLLAELGAGSPRAAAAGSAGTGSGGCATGWCRCTFSGSVVAKMNFRCGGGSSTSLSSALKPCVRDHVRLVDDVDLVAAADRGEERPLAQVTGVVDAAVAGRVDLDHVDGARARRAPGRGTTRHSPHGSAIGALLAVERSGPGSARWWSCRSRAGRRTGRRG